MSRQVGDLAGKIGVQVFQFLDTSTEQSGFGRSGHGTTVALSLAGVDQEISRSAQSKGVQITSPAPPRSCASSPLARSAFASLTIASDAARSEAQDRPQERVKQRLNTLKLKTQASSYAEVVKDALRL